MQLSGSERRIFLMRQSRLMKDSIVNRAQYRGYPIRTARAIYRSHVVVTLRTSLSEGSVGQFLEDDASYFTYFISRATQSGPNEEMTRGEKKFRKSRGRGLGGRRNRFNDWLISCQNSGQSSRFWSERAR